MGSKLYETPPGFFRARWALHRFNVDAAASDANALVGRCRFNVGGERVMCEKASGFGEPCDFAAPKEPCLPGRYYTEATNGLEPSHYFEGDRVWCNPPYENSGPAAIIRWVAMFRELQHAGVMSELLLPASTSAAWFRRYLWNDTAGHWRDGVEGHFVGRVQFRLDGQPIRDSKGKVMSSRQDNLLVTLPARGHA